MSFDLLLRPQTPIDFADFLAIFADRPNYIPEEADRQVFYENRDTGVNFVIDWLGPDDERGAGLNFSLNYFRPKVFALEAAPELFKLIADLDCAVSIDGQDRPGETYDETTFLAQWGDGNAMAHRSIAELLRSEHPGVAPEGLMRTLSEENGVLLAPGAEIETVWRWNVNREDASEELDLDDAAYFLPTLLWLVEHDSGARSVIAVWPPELPIMLPLAAEKILAPLPGPDGGPSGVQALVSAQALSRAAPGAPCLVSGEPAARYNCGFEELPAEFIEAVRRDQDARPLKDRISLYTPSALRDLDMMAAAF